MAFHKPASIAASYQWTKDTLALNLPKQQISAVFNISIWKDTIESIEYRHSRDFNTNQFANGVSAPGFENWPTFGTGRKAGSHRTDWRLFLKAGLRRIIHSQPNYPCY